MGVGEGGWGWRGEAFLYRKFFRPGTARADAQRSIRNDGTRCGNAFKPVDTMRSIEVS